MFFKIKNVYVFANGTFHMSRTVLHIHESTPHPEIRNIYKISDINLFGKCRHRFALHNHVYADLSKKYTFFL